MGKTYEALKRAEAERKAKAAREARESGTPATAAPSAHGTSSPGASSPEETTPPPERPAASAPDQPVVTRSEQEANADLPTPSQRRWFRFGRQQEEPSSTEYAQTHGDGNETDDGANGNGSSTRDASNPSDEPLNPGNGYGNARFGNGYGNARFGNGYGNARAGNGYGNARAGNGYGNARAGNGYGNARAGNGYGNARAGNGYGNARAGNGYGNARFGNGNGYGNAVGNARGNGNGNGWRGNGRWGNGNGRWGNGNGRWGNGNGRWGNGNGRWGNGNGNGRGPFRFRESYGNGFFGNGRGNGFFGNGRGGNGRGNGGNGNGNGNGNGWRGNGYRNGNGYRTFTFDVPPTTIEEFQQLRKNIMATKTPRSLQLLLVVSSRHGEGSTTTTALLGSTMAQGGRCLLIDANFRTPGLTRIFGGDHAPGLCEALADGGATTEHYHATEIPNLYFMPTGQGPTRVPYMFEGRGLDDVATSVRKEFDTILIDGAPMEMYADSSYLAPRADGTILVVQAETTPIGAPAVSLRELERVGAHVLGAVLNRTQNYIPELLARLTNPQELIEVAVVPGPEEPR